MTRGYLGWGYFGLGLFWLGVIMVWGYNGLGLFWWGYFGLGLFHTVATKNDLSQMFDISTNQDMRTKELYL